LVGHIPEEFRTRRSGWRLLALRVGAAVVQSVVVVAEEFGATDLAHDRSQDVINQGVAGSVASFEQKVQGVWWRVLIGARQEGLGIGLTASMTVRSQWTAFS